MGETKMTAAKFHELSQDSNNCVLEGFHAVKHAIRFGAKINCVISVNRAEVLELARTLAPDVVGDLEKMIEEWSPEEWRKLGVGIPTGIVAIARKRNYAIEDFDHGKPVVFLEEPRNLGNVGAVIRVAAAADAGGVLMSGTVDPWSTAVIRGSAGLQYALPVVAVDELVDTKRPLYALDPDGVNLEKINIPSDAILAFGTERGGLSETLLRRSTKRVAIPMREKVSSLNLATSVAVALYAYTINRRS